MNFAFPKSNYATRRLAPSHVEWTPHAYQKRATEFLLGQGAAALFADPGLGKTSIVLNALKQIKDAGVMNKALVIAPKRVCELVWWQESQKWSQFRGLTFAWLHDSRAPWAITDSPKRKDVELNKDVDIYIINPEGLSWLEKALAGKRFPFDTVVVDELTKFKNSQSARSKKLRKMTKRTPRIWGLTGTPAPNGYEDLFGQMLLLDGGRALGAFYTQFRDKYFVPDGFTGFEYKLAPGAAKQIEKRIAPLVLRMSAEDYLDLPPLVEDIREITLDPAARKTYARMKRDMLMALPGGEVTAANTAALYSKLAQMANGAVYLDDDGLVAAKRGVAHIHDAKLDALEDLLEELAGQQLLVAYEFNHDVDRLLARFEKYGATYIGKGVSGAKAMEIERDWNDGKIRILFAHPASTGHGLNLQQGGASHVAWFSMSWDFELYDQFIRRIFRQGNTAEHVVNHILIVKDTIDEDKLTASREKDTTQGSLLRALNKHVSPESANNPAAGSTAAQSDTENQMTVRRLSRKSDASEAPQTRALPRGWGKPASAPEEPAEEGEEEEGEDVEAQGASIRAKLRGGARPATEETEEEGGEDEAPTPPQSAFSDAVRRKMSGEDAEPENVKPATRAPRTTRTKPAAEQTGGEDTPKETAPRAVVRGRELTASQIEAIVSATAAAASAATAAAVREILGD